MPLWDYMIKSGACGWGCGGLAAVVSFGVAVMGELEGELLAAESPDLVLGILRN